MKEITRVKNERYYDKKKKALELKKVIEAIDEVNKTLNVLEEKVAPYSFYIPMKEIIDNVRDWERYTYSSRAVLIDELNGCIDIINHRIRLYNEQDVTVKLLHGPKAGMIKALKESIAKDYVECGLAVYV